MFAAAMEAASASEVSGPVATMTGYGGGNIPWIMTAVIFTSIPTILLFVWLRRYFIQGMVLSLQG